MNERLVLASASPRRAELLGGLGLMFEIRPADIDESVQHGETGATYVTRLARDKAAAVAGPGEVVIAADTTVDLDGDLLGKPETPEEAVAMLRRLSGATHQVHTGVSVHRIFGAEHLERTRVVSTSVAFADLPDHWIDWYVGTGEPMDKAGGYGGFGEPVRRLDRGQPVERHRPAPGDGRPPRRGGRLRPLRVLTLIAAETPVSFRSSSTHRTPDDHSTTTRRPPDEHPTFHRSTVVVPDQRDTIDAPPPLSR